MVCTPRILPKDLWLLAAHVASEVNPLNRPSLGHLAEVAPGGNDHAFIAALTTKYWHGGGVRLTVGFLDGPSAALQKRILSHMNAWNKTANVRFTLTSTDPQVRIARAADGYWSNVGTDILTVEPGQPTMNLEGFTMQTDDSEFHRVVRHETGHTLGFIHEHMRRTLVKQIDEKKAIAYFGSTQGWSPAMVRQQVLTPIEESSLLGTAQTDANSIMCYQIPGTITVSGKPILGGNDIDAQDFAFAAKLYPKKAAGAPASPGHLADAVARAQKSARAAARASKKGSQ
jgi:hypothetical protein